MHPKSIRTLGQASLLLLLIAALAPAPPLQLALAALAGLCAGISAAFGSGRWRIIGLVVTLLALAMALTTWPQARKHMQHYRAQRTARP